MHASLHISHEIARSAETPVLKYYLFVKILRIKNLIIHNICFTPIIYSVYGNNGEVESTLNSSVNSGSTQQCNSVLRSSESVQKRK